MNDTTYSRVGIATLGNSSRPYGDDAEVRRVVRQALLAAGLGQKSPAAPLSKIIPEGSSVLLKPNWVSHINFGGYSGDCLVTHPSVIRAVLAEVMLARPGKIILGDAPIQDCDFDKVVDPVFRESCKALVGDVPLDIIDFRRTILKESDLVNGVRNNLRPEDAYILFDLGSDSLLEPITAKKSRFRITKYDPRRLAERHYRGRHQYLLAREPFQADVVISIPKLKTHGKTGLTGALKNLVGMNGNKDFLPHHRVGGSAWGGDCYPGFAPLKRLAELFLDFANKNLGHPQAGKWANRAWRILKINRKITGNSASVEGMWHGNDTCWRMVGDLNRILRYGRLDGTMADTPQRTIFTLTDAIVCGHGEGPLASEPIFCGAITFSANPIAADLAHSALLRLDAAKIRLLDGLQKSFRWPIKGENAPDYILESRTVSLNDLASNIGVNARPPRGWLGHSEWNKVRH